MLNITETWSCMFPPEIRRHVISSCGLTHMIARHKIYVHWWLKSHRGLFSSGQSLSYAIEKLKKDSKQQDSNLRVTIYNGNRTEWSPVLSVIITAICQLRVWLQTELDDTKSCFQLIITITISEKKIHLGQTFLVGKMPVAKNLEVSQFSFQGKRVLLWLLWSILWLVDFSELV